MQIVPKTGLRGLVENWQSDMLAAVSVALVALPLALGIALASGVPPITGILSAAIGGIVTTFFRGSFVGINGPAAGLIAVILGSILALDDGSGQALNYVLAAIVVSGAIQVLLGLLKLGRLADIFHPTIIRGILAAIGVIIFAKQIHSALGTNVTLKTIIEDLIGVVKYADNINPFVVGISLLGLLLLIFHSKISYKFFHFLPAPIWILLLSIPFVYAFNFFDEHSLDFFGRSYDVGPDLLVNIPDNIMDAIAHPNFSIMDTFPFWVSVLSITMVASIISLASSKAVDKLDPYKRRTDLNKDLVGIGISTMVSGMIGGLPIITVIVRSTVNVHNHAKTKWSNLYHGILLVLFIFLLAPFIQQVPLAALAILLVYSGFKLASPKVFKQVYKQGVEQLIFFVGTLVLTIFTDVLIGISGGLLLALIVHYLMAKVSFVAFFRLIFNSGSNIFDKKDGSYEIKIKGVANFLSSLYIDKLISQIPAETKVKVDFSEARLVGLSIMEMVYDFQRMHETRGGEVIIQGLEKHVSSSNHKFAMKILTTKSSHKLTPREIRLQQRAEEHGWNYEQGSVQDVYFESFYFFKSRPIEYKSNRITGSDQNISWEISDVTFEEGAFLAYEEYKVTLEMIKVPFKIPKFIIEKKGFLDKHLNIPEHKDIDYTLYTNFPGDYKVKVDNEEEMTAFLTEAVRKLITDSDIDHIESNGEAILIFNDKLRLAQLPEYSKILKFSEDLRKELLTN